MKKYIKSSDFDGFGHSTNPDDKKTNYKYYLPDLDIDGTVEEIYQDVLNNYVTDVKALHAIQEILLQNGWGEEAKIVQYYIDEIEEETEYGNGYNISRVKIDIADGYTHAGFEDVEWGQIKWWLNCYLDGEYVYITLTNPETDITDADRVPVDEFMNMTRYDFDTWVGNLHYYGEFYDYSNEE